MPEIETLTDLVGASNLSRIGLRYLIVKNYCSSIPPFLCNASNSSTVIGLFDDAKAWVAMVEEISFCRRNFILTPNPSNFSKRGRIKRIIQHTKIRLYPLNSDVNDKSLHLSKLSTTYDVLAINRQTYQSRCSQYPIQSIAFSSIWHSRGYTCFSVNK